MLHSPTCKVMRIGQIQSCCICCVYSLEFRPLYARPLFAVYIVSRKVLSLNVVDFLIVLVSWLECRQLACEQRCFPPGFASTITVINNMTTITISNTSTCGCSPGYQLNADGVSCDGERYTHDIFLIFFITPTIHHTVHFFTRTNL